MKDKTTWEDRERRALDALRKAERTGMGLTLGGVRNAVGLTDREGDALLKRLKAKGLIVYRGGAWVLVRK